MDKDCFMNKTEKAEILEKSKIWFKTSIMEQHQVNTRKLTSIKEFNVNPFLASYLAHFLTGNAKPESIIAQNNISKFKNYKLHRELGFFH